MVELSDISYSRNATIAAVRSYYQFLTKLYLPESATLEPPPGGWPTITKDKMRSLGKTDEVIELLRHLPYLRDTQWEMQGAPWCRFMDWSSYDISKMDKEEIEGIKICTEGPANETSPAHVIGLAFAGRDWCILLLDTHLGIIYWADNCPGPLNDNPSREKIDDEPEHYAPEDEHEWRREPAWPIVDFFKLLKDEFRALHFVPLNWHDVKDVYTVYHPKNDGMISMVQRIYREHGWPSLEKYRKQKCLKAVN